MPSMKRLFLGKVSYWMEREQRAWQRQVRGAGRPCFALALPPVKVWRWVNLLLHLPHL